MLNDETVRDIFRDCLFENYEPTDSAVIAEGISCTVGFHPERLKQHTDEIKKILLELPEPFMETGGGGMSFLNACDDRHGNQWTGMHSTMEYLFLLGIGIGMVRCLVPKSMWKVLPGGVPYYVVLNKGDQK